MSTTTTKKMTLPMASMPAAIAESTAAVLKAHGLSLTPELLREIGNNATSALYALDESLMGGPDEEPSMADRLAVGETLRSLAIMGRPNVETAKALDRVGEWLSKTARVEVAKTKSAKGGKITRGGVEVTITKDGKAA